MKLLPWISEEEFNPGYIARALPKLPKSGDKPEWVHNQNYWYEREVTVSYTHLTLPTTPYV